MENFRETSCFTIRNAADPGVVEAKPWEFDVSGVVFDPNGRDGKPLPRDKAKLWYKSHYYMDPAAGHCMFSYCEGAYPGRITKENECAFVHGLVADYDGASASAADLAARPPFNDYPPTRWSTTQSGNLRLVWEFEHAVPVPSNRYASELLAEVARRVHAAKWGCELDEKASFNPAQYFDVGRRWGVFGMGARVPMDVLVLWDHDHVWTRLARTVVRKSADIPVDVVREELARRYPGRCPANLADGVRCVRFWDADADNSTGAQMTKDGFRVYTPHDDGFVPWASDKLLGRAFCEKYEAEQVSPYLSCTWFDKRTEKFIHWDAEHKNYDILSASAIKVFLRTAGVHEAKRGGDAASEMDGVLAQIMSRNKVEYMAPFVLERHGVRRISNDPHDPPAFNVSMAHVRKPYDNLWTNDWRWGNPEVRDRFPFIYGLLSNMFETDRGRALARMKAEKYGVLDENLPENRPFRLFVGWMAHFYNTAYEFKPQPGQCVVLAGGRNLGKSFFFNNVFSLLMGGSVDALNYFTGDMRFTAGIVSSPVMLIDDKIRQLEYRERSEFTGRAKSVIATGNVHYEEKFRGSVESLPWNGRIVICCNLDQDSLSILPALDQSTSDKISMFRLGSTVYDRFSRDWAENFRKADEEVPYFARFLRQFRIPEEDRDCRFGVVAYQDPEMRRVSNENSETVEVARGLRDALDTMMAADEETRKNLFSVRRGSNPSDGLLLTGPRVWKLLKELSPGFEASFKKPRFLEATLRKMRDSGAYRITGGDYTKDNGAWRIPADFDRPARKEAIP